MGISKDLHKYGLLIFDFDYTLFDTSDGVIYCIKKAFESVGLLCPGDQLLRKSIGLPLKEYFGKSTDNTNTIDAMESVFLIEAGKVMVEKTKPIENAALVIKRLYEEGYLLSISTGKYLDRVERTLINHQMRNYFSSIVCGDNAQNRKPNSEGLVKCMDYYPEINYSQVTYIGDHYYDVQAANACGIDAIAVTSGTSTPSDLLKYHPKFIINNLMELIT